MNAYNWDQNQRECQRQKALKEHERLSRLFKENRFAFERERQEAVRRLIETAPDPELRKRLWEFQARWDQRMNSAGSPHNRLALAKTLFWDHVVNKWLPSLRQVSDIQ